MAAPGGALLQFPNVWRGSEIAAVRTPGTASGFAALDRELPGHGWPGGALTEVLYPRDGIGELHLVLPALARLSRQGRRLIWIAPPHRLYAPALAHARVDLSRVTVVETVSRRDMLWAAEQALRSAAFGAVLAWSTAMKDRRPLQYAEVRRLQIALEGSDTLAFLFRPGVEARESSSAALRLGLAATADRRLAVQILKRRGTALDTAIVLKVHPDELSPDPRPADGDAAAAAEQLLNRSDHVMAGDSFPAASPRINIAGELLS